MKLPTIATLDANGKIKLSVREYLATKLERFSAASVANAGLLADQLTRVSKNLFDVTRLAGANPFASSYLLTGATCGTVGTKLLINHNLGRHVSWAVVGWRGNAIANPPVLVSDELDSSGVLTTTNTLALRSYVSGTADIVCF